MASTVLDALDDSLDFNKAVRLVIKIGSSQIVDRSGATRSQWLKALAKDLAHCSKGQEIVVVSSGAAALGAPQIKLDRFRWRLEDRQAAAAIGQTVLMNTYARALEAYDIKVAQLLLTLGDTENRRQHMNARATLRRLLSYGMIPIVNENDSVSTEELRFGDNDRLAARVAVMIEADLLIILSDVEGLYEKDPHLHPKAKHIPWVSTINAHISEMARKSANRMAHGGMITKLQAAEIAQEGGVPTVICRGDHSNPILQLKENDTRKTYFAPRKEKRAFRKRWIAASAQSSGMIIVDHGAEKALRSGKSLLPAGITAVCGNFHRGELVSVCDVHERRFAIGLSGYDSKECARIMGKQSKDVMRLQGRSARAEVIHCDDLALL